jgi:hypothetical protein
MACRLRRKNITVTGANLTSGGDMLNAGNDLNMNAVQISESSRKGKSDPTAPDSLAPRFPQAITWC